MTLGAVNVVYIDTRQKWMKREDQEMKCFWECPLFAFCASRMGSKCKHFGGEEIPKIRKRR